MSKKALFILSRISIIIIGLCGVCICIFIYPFLVSLNGLSLGNEIAMWGQLTFYWLSSIPCFVILGFAWIVSKSFNTELFTYKNARYFKYSAILLLADSIFFLIGNIFFAIINCNPFAIIFFFLIVAALSLSLAFGAAGYYITKATAIQEENKGYI